MKPTPALTQSVTGLLHLHHLLQSGQSESKEADDLRDTLDAPWYKMTESEQDMIRDLSSALYTISDERLTNE